MSHQKHQEPFNCCSQFAAIGTNGSTIKLRPIVDELLPDLRFGSTKSKEKALKFDKNGKISISSVSSVVRRMSEGTQEIFDALFK